MDFDTFSNGNERGSRRGEFPNFSTGTGQDQAVGAGSPRPEGKGFKIPAGSRKAALVYLALAAWHAGEFDPRALGEARGREVDEAGLRPFFFKMQRPRDD